MKTLGRTGKVVGYLATDWWLLLSALFLVSAVRLGFWIVSVRRVVRILCWLVPPKPGRATDPSFADRVATAVVQASRVVPGATCLTRALAAQALLERQGVPTRLHIGIIRDGGQAIRGHAWVERQGVIVLGGPMSEHWSQLLAVERGGTRCSPIGPQ